MHITLINNTLKTTQMKNLTTLLSLGVLLIMSSAFTPVEDHKLNGDLEKDELRKPILTIDWYVTDRKKELANTDVNLFYNGKHLAQLNSTTDGWFKTDLFLPGVYKVVIAQEGYLSKEIILGFNKFDGLTDEATTSVEIDLMSLNEFERVRSKSDVPRTEILIFNEKSNVFEPGFANGMFLKERFEQLKKKVKNVKRIPSSKFNS
jgi:hypothetical protein